MEQATFYPKLTQALIQSHYRFRTQEVTSADLDKEHDNLSAAIHFVIKYHLLDLLGASTPDFDFDPHFDQVGVQKLLDEIGDYAALVGFKYVLGQPIVAAVINADSYSQEELITFAGRFDTAIMSMLSYTGKVERTRLSSTGLILFTFFDHAAATAFVESAQGKCKKWHFWKKTFVIPWVIDVPARTIKRHTGLPLITDSILNADGLRKALFET